MQVSEVNIHFIKPQGGLFAFASVVVNGDLFLTGIGIHRKLDGSGHRLTYPTRKTGEQSFELFYPINRAAGQEIETAILAKLNDVLNRLDDDVGHGCHHAV